MYLCSDGETCGCPAMDAKFEKPRNCMVTAESLTLPMFSLMRCHHYPGAACGDCPQGAAVCSSPLLPIILKDVP